MHVAWTSSHSELYHLQPEPSDRKMRRFPCIHFKYNQLAIRHGNKPAKPVVAVSLA